MQGVDDLLKCRDIGEAAGGIAGSVPRVSEWGSGRGSATRWWMQGCRALPDIARARAIWA
jgi:hypothetical protein